MALEQSIGDLIAATERLTAQVVASMGEIETRIEAKLEEADIHQIIHDLLASGEIPVSVDPDILSDIISQKIASGELGTQAMTLGGRPASEYLRKNTVIDAGRL